MEIKDIVAPTMEQKRQRLETFKSYIYYFIIGILLLIVLFVVPLLSGGILAEDFTYYLPDTSEGWVIFWALRIGNVIANLAIYGLFKMQAKVNARDNKNYKEARELLGKISGKFHYIPMSPKKKAFKDWTTKGVWMLMTTLGQSIVIGSLIMSFDVMTFLSCIISSITCVIFGIIAMIKDEVYWTSEYLEYAKWQVSQIEKEENKSC